MKGISSWVLSAAVALVLVGISSVVLGVFLFGTWMPTGSSAGGAQGQIAELRKKSEQLTKHLQETVSQGADRSQRTFDHRIFVSRTLLFLPQQKEQVQPMQDDLVTSDGIKVGWKIKHGLDLEDSGVADQDDDSDGFSNKEEYDKGTDPADPASSPSRWVKLRIVSVDPEKITVSFTGKSDDRFTLRFTGYGRRKESQVVVGDHLWLAVSGKAVEVVTSEVQAKTLLESKAYPHLIPFNIKGYKADRGKRMNEKTKTETDYDDSYLEVERTDGVPGLSKVLIEEVGYKYEKGVERGVQWPVGDIRLISLVPGEGEMGPYRIGQSFAYAGKEFVLLGASPEKVTLQMRPEGEEVLIRPKTP
ncbi:MAG: hypothetical protein EB090_01180 [Verrucomicrobia bacterium]|nr:hypothetical protein [Verrucomicrobiota bacterium]